MPEPEETNIPLTVRQYNQADRAAVHRIAADTAFFGEPVEAFLADRQLFVDLFYAYYTDMEARSGWVACVGPQVVGFLMGCVDTRAHSRKWVRNYLPLILSRLLRRHYRLGKLTRRYAIALARAGLRGEFPHADLTMYPAHFHLNMEARWRGQGGGRCLIEAYLNQLRQLQVPGVHLNTTSLNEAACQLYVRLGFHLLDARPTRMWAGWIDRPVENRCYGLRLCT